MEKLLTSREDITSFTCLLTSSAVPFQSTRKHSEFPEKMRLQNGQAKMATKM